MAPSELDPLLPVLVSDEEPIKQLRDRVTTQYTTIALVSALLSAVSFAAYATPPAAIFASATAAPPPAPGMMAPPPPLHGKAPPGPPPAVPLTGFSAFWVNDVKPELTMQTAVTIENVILQLLWHLYGIVMPLAFVCNLGGTLAASGVILYANSTLANGPAIRRLFGNKISEHAIIRYPAGFLFVGVLSLFAGFCIGICLFYGIVVALVTLVATLIAYFIYERFFAHASTNDTFNALNLSLLALFFRSCMPELAKQADAHQPAAAVAEAPEDAAAMAAEEAREAEEEAERKRAEWDARADAIGRAVAEQLRAEPVVVRRDPREDTADFAKKKGGCCK